MSYLNINPDLFLEVAELNRLKQFLDDNGFRKNILQNTVGFGLIKNKYSDPNFSNASVERDLDTALGQKTIKVRQLFGVDNLGNFLFSPETDGIAVPNDGNWYWIKIAHSYTNVEKGVFTISGNGDLVDTSGLAELTKIFRGFPNFPVRVSFSDSQFNTLQYDVLEVIDDQHATLQHPATNANGISQFTPENGLSIEVVGTFTPGVAVPVASQLIFNYDSAVISLIQENFVNTPPTPQVVDVEFYIARVKVSGSTVLIQDKRNQFWETKGSELPLEIERRPNTLVGIESIQYNNFFSAGDKNIVQVGWAMRSANWSVDTSNNIVTFNSGQGGKYKTVNDFNNGDFDGWRLYFPGGTYSKILTSVKQGSAINLTLDFLDVNNLSTDGGTTLLAGTLIAAPDCDSVEILFSPDPRYNETAIIQPFVFPANEGTGRCDVLVFSDPLVQYNVQYRYKSLKEYSQWRAIPSDIVNGYLTENSFDSTDNLNPPDQRVRFKYTSDPILGFIQMQLSPNSIKKFKNKVDKGDIIGVTNLTDISNTAETDLTVGFSNNYTYISGSPSLQTDVSFVLNRTGSVSGNEFRIHFDCTAITFNGHHIYIVVDALGGTVLKEIMVGDVYAMLNQQGGIVLDLVFNGADWVVYQNYDLGSPNQIKYIDGVIDTQFDSTGFGKVRGLFGHVLMDGRNGADLRHLFIVGVDPTIPAYLEGEEGGAAEHIIAMAELPAEGVLTKDTFLTSGDNTVAGIANYPNQDLAPPDNTGTHRGDTSMGTAAAGNNKLVYREVASANLGIGTPIAIVPPYYAAIICKKIY